MTAPAPEFAVKGWCPGALRPMESGDGLIVRVRPFCASLSLAEMRGIADAADRYGNGHIDLTRRANLQIRGVSDATLRPLQDALRELGLLDDRPEAEAVRNILVGPLAGLDPSEVLDMRPLAQGLAAMLAAEPEAWSLPGKFAVVLDGGGVLPLSGERADMRLRAIRVEGARMIALGIDRAAGAEWLGMASPGNAVAAVFAAVRICAGAGARAKDVSHEAIARIRSSLSPLGADGLAGAHRTGAAIRRIGAFDMGDGRAVLGLGIPFGRLEASQLRALADLLAEHAAEASDIRLSPWRAFYIPVQGGVVSERVMLHAGGLGYVVDAADPLMRIEACPGRPACRSAHADTRADAKRIASWMATGGFSGAAHVSGCAKGCASSAPASLMLVGVPGGYRLLRDARPRDEGGVLIRAADIPARLDALTHAKEGTPHG